MLWFTKGWGPYQLNDYSHATKNTYTHTQKPRYKEYIHTYTKVTNNK